MKLSNTFYEENITLTPKPHEDIKKKNTDQCHTWLLKQKPKQSISKWNLTPRWENNRLEQMKFIPEMGEPTA
jgi:hypothetical protein